MEKHFYFVRHGETIGNRLWRHQSRNTSLTALGERQAKSIAAALKNIPIDLIITSGALRAQQTALPLLEIAHCPIINNPLFEEFRRPSKLIGRHYFSFFSISTLLRSYIHAGNPKWHHSDEENFVQFFTRAVDATEFLAAQKVSHIVVVSHRLFLAVLLAVISGYDHPTTSALLTFLRFERIPNGSITELTYDHNRSVRWHIISRANTSHLTRAIAKN